MAMSCFALLCEEADIRGGSDEVTATYLLPNYHVYQARILRQLTMTLLLFGQILKSFEPSPYIVHRFVDLDPH